jgi:hypothetical protein
MSNNKSILIITQYFYPEEFGINDLALEWVNKNYKVTILTQTPNYPFDKIYDGYSNKFIQKEIWKGITVYRVKAKLGSRLSRSNKVLGYLNFTLLSTIFSIFLIRKFKKVLVYQVGPLTQIIAGIVLRKLFRKELYLWVLDIWPDTVYAYGFKKSKLNTSILNYFVKIAYNSCHHIMASNRGFVDKIKKITKVDVTFIPQWVPRNLNFVNASPQKELNGYFNFTFAGNVGMVQNLENLIKGFDKITINERVRFNIIGDGSNLANLKALVLKNNVKNVFFLGRQPLSEIPNWLMASQVLIISLIDQPNFSITVPAKFQAYLAAQKPIFCCMKGEAVSLVENYELGISCDPDSIPKIKNTFEQFMKFSEHDLAKFAEKSGKLTESFYNFYSIESKMARIIFH